MFESEADGIAMTAYSRDPTLFVAFVQLYFTKVASRREAVTQAPIAQCCCYAAYFPVCATTCNACACMARLCAALLTVRLLVLLHRCPAEAVCACCLAACR